MRYFWDGLLPHSYYYYPTVGLLPTLLVVGLHSVGFISVTGNVKVLPLFIF